MLDGGVMTLGVAVLVWYAAMAAWTAYLRWLSRAFVMMCNGDLAAALALAAKRAPRAGAYEQHLQLNVLICAGEYRKALELGSRLKARDGWFSTLWSLAQTNLAEAEYNLGRWDEALRRLDVVAQRRVDKLTGVGLTLQRAWILSVQHRANEARAAFANARIADLPAQYQAEYHYTAVAVLLAEGNWADALTAADAGLAIATRASSRRNGTFLRARCLAALGREDEALTQFARAADAAYRHQGGDGLLAWGDLLLRLGTLDEARSAWRLAIERDGESESAHVATSRLADSMNGFTATH